MSVYKTILYASLEKPLNTVVIYNRNVKNELYRGPFENIPQSLYNCKVNARLYEYTVKTLTLWVHS